MCLNPRRVLNPYYNEQAYQYLEGDLMALPGKFVSAEQTLLVPCGECADCRNSYMLSILQRVQMEALTSYVYFVTLTYNDESLPYLSFTAGSNQVNLYYSDKTHIQSMMKRLRNEDFLEDRDFRYLAVTEYGTEKFRPHHHLLLFVAKKKDDPDFAPQYLESVLKSTLCRLYGENVGTRKHPVYKPYFTYAKKIIKGKEYSNYDVRLVRDYDIDPGEPGHFNSVTSVQKSVSYLLSYINKPSKFDAYLFAFLDSVKESKMLDVSMLRKLKSILKCQCYYSKYLGFGFDEDGRKVVPSLRCRSVSNVLYNVDSLLRSLPDDWFEFVTSYTDLANEVEFARDRIVDWFNFQKNQKSIEDLFCGYNSIDYLHFRLVHKYFPKAIDSFLMSTHFDQRGYYPSRLPSAPYDDSYKNSVVYKALRRSIDQGLSQSLPYFAFEYYDKSIVKYAPLCSYYKRYVVTFEDVSRLYDSLGVSNYDEYQKLFEFNLEAYEKHALSQLNNRDKHENAGNLMEIDYKKIKNGALVKKRKKLFPIFAPTFDTITKLL